MKEREHLQKLFMEAWRKLGADVCRIENVAGTGMPDINVCFRGVEFWVETKIQEDIHHVPLRPEQNAWIIRRSTKGGRVYVLTRIGDTVHLWGFNIMRGYVLLKKAQIFSVLWKKQFLELCCTVDVLDY